MTDKEIIKRLYRGMSRIRLAEELIEKIYPQDKIKSPVHLAIGHEFAEVGVCDNLTHQDTAFGYYRSHGLYLAKGGNMDRMFAELYGKTTGCCRGKGGSMHLIDTSVGMMGTSAIVASSIPNAVGQAYTQKYLKLSDITVSFFGDGATEEGVFTESLNFAALKKLPVLFVCINNGMAIYTEQNKRQAQTDISVKAQAAGVNSTKITSGDIFEVHDRSREIISRLRSGQGPEFLEITTSRWRDHVGPGEDFHLGHRDDKEVRTWQSKDEIARLSTMIPENERTLIDADIDLELKQAVDFAESSPWPEPGELYNLVYC